MYGMVNSTFSISAAAKARGNLGVTAEGTLVLRYQSAAQQAPVGLSPAAELRLLVGLGDGTTQDLAGSFQAVYTTQVLPAPTT